jgi:putative sigma-54 modulation protein
MKINITTVHFDADQKLIDFVNQKVKKLTQFYDEIISSEIILRLDANDELGNKISEIRLVLAGRGTFCQKAV